MIFLKEDAPAGRNRYNTPHRATVATVVLNGGELPTAVSGGGRSLPPFTVEVEGYFCQS
jgi:hypothetical protein